MTVTFTFSRSFATRVEPTENVVELASMFGIGLDESITITLYKDLEVKIGPGRIIYITGDSGAGKTTLLRDIASRSDEHADTHLIEDVDVSKMPEKPLVDQFGDWPIKEIGQLLAFVGIAEAFVYLRKPRELSDGQRYRFKIAKMIFDAKELDSEATAVICIDEFLAFLDRETAKNVAYQTRRVSTIFGLCFVVATTHEDIAPDLRANQSITMRLNLPPELKTTALAGI